MLGVEYFGNLEHYCFEKYDISDFRHTNLSANCKTFRMTS